MKFFRSMFVFGVLTSIVNTANARPPMENERPGDCKSARCGGGGGGGGGGNHRPNSSMSALAPGGVELATFKEKAIDNKNRCIVGRDIPFCNRQLDYALKKNLIRSETYDWGKANEYYPVVTHEDIVDAVCKCGCFDKNTEILLSDNGTEYYKKIESISKYDKIFALTNEATLTNMEIDTFDIESTTVGPEKDNMYVFYFPNKKVLKLTSHHGVLLSDGTMIAAKDVKVGQKMISFSENRSIEILEIKREKASGEVYNLDVDGQENVNHIIIANDIFVGDVAWQNSLASELGSIQVRQ